MVLNTIKLADDLCSAASNWLLPMSATVEIPALARHERAIVPGAPAVGSRRSGVAHLPFALTIFLSAFLLFQVQLLLGKELLPLFGGAPAVWTACVLVFQLLFLAGYGYSHGLAAWLPVRRRTSFTAPFWVFPPFIWPLWPHPPTPIGFAANVRPQPGASPAWAIMELLFVAIGLPFSCCRPQVP
jgi:hypothetical protein